MFATRIATRYAKALLDLAVEKGDLAQVIENIQAFQQSVKGSRGLFLFLKSPIINAGKKSQIFNMLFTDYDKMTLAFFNIILNKGREAILPEIADEYMELHKKLNKVSTVHVTTAVPADEATLDTIKQKLLSSGLTNQNLDIKLHVDPNIIGGYIIEFDGQLYDASVAIQLKKLRNEFDDNHYIGQILKQ